MKNKVDWLVSQLKIVGGAETFLLEMAPRLRQAGWDLRVLTLVSGGTLVEELHSANVPVIELGVRSKVDLGAAGRLLRLWREDPPDLIHTHLYHAGILGRTAARLLGLGPVIVHQQGPERARSSLRTGLDRVTSPWVDQYLTTCQAVAQILQQREKIPAEKIQVIYNGIKQNQALSTTKPAEWPVPPGRIGLVCVGRLSPEKGQAVLIEALSLLKKNDQMPFTVFLGDGVMRSELEKRCKDLNLNSDVFFAGVRRDILEWLHHFDLFVLSSDWEGVSLALLEALSAGLPVIATGVGGTPEIVIDEASGLLVPPRSPQSLAEAINRLCSDRELRLRLAKAGQKRIADHFTIEETVRQFDLDYRSLLRKD